MILLIDGPDGTGKTTVCNILAEKLEWPIVKMPNMKEYFDKGMTEEFSKFFNEMLLQFKGFDFILDRGYTSSLVYSKVYERQFDLSYLYNYEKDLNAKVIILTVSDEKMYERRPVDEIIINELRSEIRDEFERLAASHNYKLIDTSNLTPEEVVEEILYND